MLNNTTAFQYGYDYPSCVVSILPADFDYITMHGIFFVADVGSHFQDFMAHEFEAQNWIICAGVSETTITAKELAIAGMYFANRWAKEITESENLGNNYKELFFELLNPIQEYLDTLE